VEAWKNGSAADRIGGFHSSEHCGGLLPTVVERISAFLEYCFVIRETNEVYEINTCTPSGLMIEYKQGAEGSIKDETDTSQQPLFTGATTKPNGPVSN
jgi:hypothetical protein